MDNLDTSGFHSEINRSSSTSFQDSDSLVVQQLVSSPKSKPINVKEYEPEQIIEIQETNFDDDDDYVRGVTEVMEDKNSSLIGDDADARFGMKSAREKTEIEVTVKQ